MLPCSSFPHDKRAERKHLLMFQTSWCLAVLVSPGYHAGIGGRVGGDPVLESYSGTQLCFSTCLSEEELEETIKVVWPWEVWMARALWAPMKYCIDLLCKMCSMWGCSQGCCWGLTPPCAAVPLFWGGHSHFVLQHSFCIYIWLQPPWTMLGVAGDMPATLRNNVFKKAHPN